MTTIQLLERTRSHITENFLYTRPEYVIEPGESLLESGIIDSMGVMELIEFLQDEFSITIADEEITEDNLGTLEAIAGFVAAKRTEGVAA